MNKRALPPSARDKKQPLRFLPTIRSIRAVSVLNES